jgi:hypothetical protein
MPRLRTRTVRTKMSEDDYALSKQLAGDQRVDEWVRNVLFKAVLAERTAEGHRTIFGRGARPQKHPTQPAVGAGAVGFVISCLTWMALMRWRRRT